MTGKTVWRGGEVVIGKCYACGGPLTRINIVRISDPVVGVTRKLHRGACAMRFEVQRGPDLKG